jgi:hypothetical protein
MSNQTDSTSATEEGTVAEPQSSCVREKGQDPWYLPTRHLNALWSDLYPRVAARVWRAGPGDPAWPAAGDMKPWLIQQATEFGGAASISPPADVGRSDAFRTRMQALADFLQQDDAVPITYHPGVDAFDFILSEEGLDLFHPPDPNPVVTPAQRQKDLLGYYTYRSTGRTPIAVPGVYTPVALPSPEVEVLNPGSNLTSTQGPSQVPALPGNVGLASWVASGAGSAKNGEPPPAPRRNVGQEMLVFWCERREGRCWQVSGTVTRAILVEHPRVIAHIWHDTGPENAGCPTFGSYPALFDDPGDTGLRLIFRERLETSLPPASRMVFEATMPALPAFYNGEDARVLITHDGFFFPPPGQPPQFTQMMTEIVEGRAGNPVFTDSSRSA